MAQGTVKFFSAGRGYGFINPAQGGEDVFVHYSVIQADGFRTLKEGDRVEYSVVETPKGYQAKTSHMADFERFAGAVAVECPAAAHCGRL